MATVNVTLRVRYDQEQGTFSTQFIGGATANRGDTVIFTVSGSLDAGNGNLTYISVYDWDSSIWTDSSIVTLSGVASGQTFTKYVRSDATYGVDVLAVDTVVSGVSRTTGITPDFEILPPADTTPDAFSLGPDLVELQPTDKFTASLVTVSGINTGVNATISTTGGTAYFTVNNGTAQTSATVTNGQKIQVFGTAAGLYSTSSTITLNIGGVEDSFTVTTTSTPPTEGLIQFVSNPITLGNVKSFFGGIAGPGNLRSYLRGGSYVPDISQNAGVPMSGSLKLSDFGISYTTLFFSKFPKSIIKSANTISGSTSLNQTWSIGSVGDDKFDVGFGPGMYSSALFSYSIVEDTGSGKSTGVTLAVESGSASIPTQGNTYVVVQSPVQPANSEARYSGTLTITAIKGAVSRSTTCKYYFNFYGP